MAKAKGGAQWYKAKCYECGEECQVIVWAANEHRARVRAKDTGMIPCKGVALEITEEPNHCEK